MGVSAHDMIGRLRYNKSLLRKKRLFKKDKSYRRLKGEFEAKAEKDNIQLKKATKEQLTTIREKILIEKKAERTIQWLVVLVFVPLLSFVVYTYYNALKPSKAIHIQNQIALKEAKKERQNQYTYFITSGDEWLAKSNWYNAIFEYKKAISIYPTDFNANYRLALAYTYNCHNTNENCEAAEQLIIELLKHHENNNGLNLLHAIFFMNIGDSAKAMLDYEQVSRLMELAKKPPQ